MDSKLKVLAVIPARSGSKGIPRKNVLMLHGKPLMHYSIATALRTEGVSKVIVSTDTVEFADIARAAGAEVPFLRPEALARDEVRLVSVISHALQYYDEFGERFDAVLSVQATAPMTRVATLEAMIKKMRLTGCDAVATVSEVRHEHPYIVQLLAGQDGDLAKPFLELPDGLPRYPRQVRPQLHVFTGAAFLRRRHLIEQGDMTTNALGQSPRVVITDPIESINIDDEADLMLAEYYLSQRGILE